MNISSFKRNKHFEKQFQKLLKKFKTLEEDLEKAENFAIKLFFEKDIDSNSIFKIEKYSTDKIKIYKLKKFACKSLKGKGVQSGIRIIFAHILEGNEIEYLQIYYKEKQDSDMDEKQVKEYIKGTD
jgi:hypothetical protein